MSKRSLEQAGERYRKMSEEEKRDMTDNIIENMMFVDEVTQKIVIEYLKVMDTRLSNDVEKGIV